MTKWNRGIAAALTATALLAGGFAFAQDRGHGPGGHGGPLAYIISQIDLTEDQQEMVDTWREEIRAERDAMRAEREQVRETLRAELTSGNPNPRTFHRLIDERAAERTEHMHDQVDRFFELYATFTDEQKAEVARIVEEGPPEGEGPRGPGEGEGYRGGRGGWQR